MCCIISYNNLSSQQNGFVTNSKFNFFVSNIFTIGGLGMRIGKYIGFCYFLPFFAYLINLCNRLLTVGIVIYRYVFVIKNHLVKTPQQRQKFSALIFGFIIIISIFMTGWALYYKDKYHHFWGQNCQL